MCAVVKADGKVCGAWCDKRVVEGRADNKSGVCEYHLERAVQRRRAGRNEFAAGYVFFLFDWFFVFARESFGCIRTPPRFHDGCIYVREKHLDNADSFVFCWNEESSRLCGKLFHLTRSGRWGSLIQTLAQSQFCHFYKYFFFFCDFTT